MKKIALLLLFMISAKTFAQLPAHPVKLRVGTYNVGHFNQGKLGGYQGEDVDEELTRWRKWIGEQSIDILSVNEWNIDFDNQGKYNATDELLVPYYNNRYFGDANSWIYNGLITNYTLTNLRQVNWHGQYYAIIGDLHVNGKVITLMSTHIPWQKEHHQKAIDDMLAEMKKYEYLVCMGDMNALNITQLNFYAEGFNIANGGYEGWFCTSPVNKEKGKTDVHIDNIITTSNIKIMNVSAPFTGLNDRDHLPVLADIVITFP